MCYSYSNTIPAETYRARFGVEQIEPDLLRALYRVSAFDLPQVPVITGDRPEELQFFLWGLIPHWVKNRQDAEKIRFQTMNARAESLFEKPSYRDAGRCLIPADGFYESHTEGKNKQPYYITMKDRLPFAFAGLWDTWTDPKTGERLKTCSIVTVPASPLLAAIHNTKQRMPAILRPEDEAAWLDPATAPRDLKTLLSPFDDAALAAWPVARTTTRRGTDSNTPAAQQPLPPDALPRQERLL